MRIFSHSPETLAPWDPRDPDAPTGPARALSAIRASEPPGGPRSVADPGPPLRAASHRYVALQEPFEESTTDLFRQGTGSGPIFLPAGGGKRPPARAFSPLLPVRGDWAGKRPRGRPATGPVCGAPRSASFRPSMHLVMNVGVFSHH